MQLPFISDSETAIRICLAALFGAIIGLERERKNWSAGMRTHMMVCVGSALVMIVSAFGFSDMQETEHVSLDPSRIAAQVISGIGFIGAGTILVLQQGMIRGLTTASGLWTVAAIGLATGSGMYFAAGTTTAVALVILWGLQPLEQLYSRRFKQHHLHITVKAGPESSPTVSELLLRKETDSYTFTMDKDKNETTVQIQFNKTPKEELMRVIKRLEADNAVKMVTWSDQ